MDKEKEIEEIYDILIEFDDGEYLSMATTLSDAGYGNVKQAVKEFAEKIKDWLHGADLYFYNGQEEFILDGKEEVDEKIDDFIKELYGDD